MQNDEQAIRALVEKWMAASRDGDTETVLQLMTDDIIFMVPGREPFGKDEFAALSHSMKNVRMEGRHEVKEIKVLGDWAWMRNWLEVRLVPMSGEPVVQSGYTLTILRRNPQGSWAIARDANLLTQQAA